MQSPRPALRLEPGGADREQTAARRLALLAADLGADPTLPSARQRTSDEPDEDDDVVVDGLWWADHTRVTGTPVAAPEPEAADTVLRDTGGDLPPTGRHAAPRSSGWPSLPELGVAHLAVIALVVAVALAGTTWWLLRDRAEAVVVPDVAAEVPALVAAQDDPPPAEVVASGTVVVDVSGKVRRPGIVELDEGARVVDALQAAGGPRRGVDTTDLNLARVLVDGEQILVGVEGSPAAPPPPHDGGTGATPAALVNINTADVAELQTLPRVGPVTAAAIVNWRDQNGAFTAVDQLIAVDGIGEKTLAQLAPHVTV